MLLLKKLKKAMETPGVDKGFDQFLEAMWWALNITAPFKKLGTKEPKKEEDRQHIFNMLDFLLTYNGAEVDKGDGLQGDVPQGNKEREERDAVPDVVEQAKNGEGVLVRAMKAYVNMLTGYGKHMGVTPLDKLYFLLHHEYAHGTTLNKEQVWLMMHAIEDVNYILASRALEANAAEREHLKRMIEVAMGMDELQGQETATQTLMAAAGAEEVDLTKQVGGDMTKEQAEAGEEHNGGEIPTGFAEANIFMTAIAGGGVMLMIKPLN